jgi:hypothetical protein
MPRATLLVVCTGLVFIGGCASNSPAAPAEANDGGADAGTSPAATLPDCEPTCPSHICMYPQVFGSRPDAGVGGPPTCVPVGSFACDGSITCDCLKSFCPYGFFYQNDCGYNGSDWVVQCGWD